jgi:hypothetical protein
MERTISSAGTDSKGTMFANIHIHHSQLYIVDMSYEFFKALQSELETLDENVPLEIGDVSDMTDLEDEPPQTTPNDPCMSRCKLSTFHVQ